MSTLQIENIIRYGLYTFLISTLIIILYPILKYLKPPVKPFTKKMKSGGIYHHLLKVTSVLPGRNDLWTDGIIALTYGLVAITFLNIRHLGKGVFFVAIIMGLIPYGLLRVILSFKRIEASKEGESLIGELLKQYKLCAYNMPEAIDESMKSLNHCPHSKRNLYHLSEGLRAYQSEKDLKLTLDTFMFSVNTRWMKLLSNNMYMAIMSGHNVAAGLTDILKELSIAKKEKEQEKRMNFDGFLIAIIINPLIYIASILTAKAYFEVPVSEFFRLQLSSSGIKLFIGLIIFNSINFLIVFLQKYKKLDYT